ncbi:MAG: hypothetical protein ACI8XO_003787 [Verrucomicrobiales bacterium]|jgi:hypothetical protein
MRFLISISAAFLLPLCPANALELLSYWNFDNQTENQSKQGNDAALTNGAVI